MSEAVFLAVLQAVKELGITKLEATTRTFPPHHPGSYVLCDTDEQAKALAMRVRRNVSPGTDPIGYFGMFDVGFIARKYLFGL